MQAAATAQAERDRIAAINALPEAKGREGLAMNLATTTSMTVAQARAALAAAPLSAAGISAQWDAVLKSRGMIGGV
ncbi:hypothetical protein [Bradyrhizobium sp. th.b2]|uniref:hypothetical protein n=1 Tax=Bradyrhizobium sp. th-b2 TaxID=172088 RepID=UPI0004004690|nr:hypothetical protein [Bradyrhizobium sp. th.b2]